MPRKGDWVPCRGYAQSVPLSGGSPSVEIILLRTTYDSVADDDAVARLEGAAQVVVQRVVGQVRLAAPLVEEASLVGMRIRTGIYDDELDQAAFMATSLFDGADANEPFLWQRYVAVEAGGDTFGSLGHPWWCSLDVRVARRLERNMGLFLSVQVPAAFPVGSEVIVQPFLRTWARAVT